MTGVSAMGKLRSPLRYPGSKSNLVDYLSVIIKEKVGAPCEIFEPYAGGASVSLGMLGQGLASKATLVERDPLLYAFWKCVKEETVGLCEKIQDTIVDLDTWQDFRKYLSDDALDRWSLLELGFAGLYFNRTNFSGILGAKPIGGMSQTSPYKIDCRFPKERIIEDITRIAEHKEQIEVCFGDAVDFMKDNRELIEEGFVYVDPPYYLTGKKLYRYHYNLAQHSELAQFLDSQSFPWVVSVDSCPEILSLYSNQKVVPIFLSYVIKKSRRAEELLISNLQLRAPVYDAIPGDGAEQLSLPAIASAKHG
jgi:DNA adenine methylase